MKEQELTSLLTGQTFDTDDSAASQLETAQKCAYAFAQATGGIAVISDFQKNVCHIYSGQFGRILGLPQSTIDASSAFEREIFGCIPDEELLERHILELRFFQFLKTVPNDRKTDYCATCLILFRTPEHATLPVLHSTRYIKCQPNGSVMLGLCTYTPFPQCSDNIRGIVDTRTGQTVDAGQYRKYDSRLLSRRQIEILVLLAKGLGSKQIADRLCLSTHTISRHRQDILDRLNVTNTAAAVEIGLRMNLLNSEI